MTVKGIADGFCCKFVSSHLHAAGIHTEGKNEWKTIIHNTSLHLITIDQKV